MLGVKDTIVAVGVIITAVLGLLNLGYALRHNRRASYVGSVTATRLKWISDVRERLAEYVALVYQLVDVPPADRDERYRMFTLVVRARMALRLHLAPEPASADDEFQTLIEQLFQTANRPDRPRTLQEIEQLIAVGQRFLWAEWRKVKREAIKGDPYDTVAYRLQRWSAANRQGMS